MSKSSLGWAVASCVLLGLGAGSANTASAAGKPANASATRVPGVEQVKSLTLANGMKVIVWTDRDIPNVALYNWVRVGSRNEVPGITGLAHFFEHMMFNGTAKRTRGEFDRLMEAQGGSNNAFTSDDVTVYQDWVPRTALDLVFDLESDRLPAPLFAPTGAGSGSAGSCIRNGGCAPKTATRGSSPNKCRPRRSSRIRTRIRLSAGRPTF